MEAKDITQRTTKKELIALIENQQKQIDSLKANKVDSKSGIKETEEKRTVECADKTVSEYCDSYLETFITDYREAVQEYSELQKAIALKTVSLKNLYDIEGDMFSFEAVHNAYVDYKAETKALTEKLEEEYAKRKEELEDEIQKSKNELWQNFNKQKEDLTDKYNKENKEFEYQINFEHRQKMDELQEELKQERVVFQTACDAKSEELNRREKELTERESIISNRETIMDELEETSKKSFDDGYKQGCENTEKEMTLNNSLKDAEHDKELALLQAEIESINGSYQELNAQCNSLKQQLAEAHRNNHSLAEKIVEMSGKSNVFYAPMNGYQTESQNKR